MADWSESIRNSFLQQLKTVYLHISITTTITSTKLDRVVTYHEEVPPINSLDPLITWSCNITWQTKIITPLAGLLPIWSHDFARSRDKLTPLYLHCHSAFGHQTWQNGDLSRGAPNHKVTQRCDHVVLQSHVKTKIVIFPLLQCLWPANLTRW